MPFPQALVTAVKNGDFPGFTKLLDATLLNETDEQYGLNLASYCLWYNRPNFAEHVIQHPQFLYKNYETLNWAALRGNEKAVNLLLTAPDVVKDINLLHSKKETALSNAILSGSLPCVKAIHAKGGDKTHASVTAALLQTKTPGIKEYLNSAVVKEEKLSNQSALSSDQIAKVELAKAVAFDNRYDYPSAFPFYLLAAQNGNLEAMWTTARRLHEGKGVKPNLEEAVFWYAKGFPFWVELKDRQDIASQLKRIASLPAVEPQQTSAKIKDEKGDIPSSSRLETEKYSAGIIKANAALMNFLLDETDHSDTSKDHIINSAQHYFNTIMNVVAKLPFRSERYFSETIPKMVNLYHHSKNQKLKETLISLLSVMETIPFSNFEAYDALIACASKELANKTISPQLLFLAIKKIEGNEKRNKLDEKNLSDFLLAKANLNKDNPELALDSFLKSYNASKDAKILFEAIKIESSLKKEPALNEHIAIILNPILEKPLTDELIPHLDELHKLSTDPVIKQKIDAHKEAHSLKKFAIECETFAKPPLKPLGLLQYAEAHTSGVRNKIIEENFNTYFKNFEEVLNAKKPNGMSAAFPFSALNELEFDKNSVQAAQLNKRLEKFLLNLGKSNNWYTHYHLCWFYETRYNSFKKDASKTDLAIEAFTKMLYWMEEVLKNNDNHNGLRSIKTGLVTGDLTKYSIDSSIPKPLRLKMDAMIIDHNQSNAPGFSVKFKDYKETQALAGQLANREYLPAIFHLANLHANNKNWYGALKPHMRRAISLYLKASILIAGMTSEEAEKIFNMKANDIQYWREIGEKFISKVAQDYNQQNTYRGYAAWVTQFIKIVTDSKTRFIESNLDVDAYILTAIDNWDSIAKKANQYSESTYTLESYKDFYTKGINQSLNANVAAKITDEKIIPSVFVKQLFTPATPSKVNVETTNTTVDVITPKEIAEIVKPQPLPIASAPPAQAVDLLTAAMVEGALKTRLSSPDVLDIAFTTAATLTAPNVATPIMGEAPVTQLDAKVLAASATVKTEALAQPLPVNVDLKVDTTKTAVADKPKVVETTSPAAVTVVTVTPIIGKAASSRVEVEGAKEVPRTPAVVTPIIKKLVENNSKLTEVKDEPLAPHILPAKTEGAMYPDLSVFFNQNKVTFTVPPKPLVEPPKKAPVDLVTLTTPPVQAKAEVDSVPAAATPAIKTTEPSPALKETSQPVNSNKVISQSLGIDPVKLVDAKLEETPVTTAAPAEVTLFDAAVDEILKGFDAIPALKAKQKAEEPEVDLLSSAPATVAAPKPKKVLVLS